MNVAVIPARGGSKRIPGKNIKPFCGRPMIGWPLEVALKSGLFRRVIVSTDSQEIAATAREWGAEVPFLRPAALADDFTPTADVLAHALEWLREQGESYQRCCLIYPTAVFATVRDLAAGLELLRESGAGAVIPVAAFPAPIQRAFVMNEAGRLSMLWPEHELTRTNDLPESYHDAGQFYWLDCDRFLKGRKIYTDDAVGLVLPRYRVVDIDTPEDWQVAEHLFRAFRSAQSRTMEVTP